MKIDWKQKLTSRKFWAAVAGFIGPLLVAFGASENEVERVVALIMAGAAVIAYIIGEGLIDAARETAKEPELEVVETLGQNPVTTLPYAPGGDANIKNLTYENGFSGVIAGTNFAIEVENGLIAKVSGPEEEGGEDEDG